MSILATSPTAIRVIDVNIWNALGSFEAALILQQLHYWMEKKGVGVIVNDAKYIYNSFKDWVSQQFISLTTWKFRKAMKILRDLGLVDVIRYKEKKWDQTNYYSLNYAKLREWGEAESIEIAEMWSSTPQDDGNQTLEVENPSTSYKEAKNTNQRETTKQEHSASDRTLAEEKIIAAVTSKEALEEKKGQTESNPHSESSTAPNSQKKVKSEPKQSNSGEEKKAPVVDYIVNKKLISLLDDAGVAVNRTIKDLLKLYPSDKVENAIAILKQRKREKHVSNPSGYFIAALKGDWESQNMTVEGEGDTEGVDKGAVFRHWYDLAKQLGYCSGQEQKDGEQWVCLSGSWEKWSDAVDRGYSIEYLKKIIKRNNRQ